MDHFPMAVHLSSIRGAVGGLLQASVQRAARFTARSPFEAFGDRILLLHPFDLLGRSGESTALSGVCQV